MKDTDRKAFLEALQAVYALHRVDLSRAVIELWWRCLEGYDLPAVLEALGRATMNPDSGQFLPKPADVVKMLGGTTKDAAIVAFAKVAEAVRHVGAWSSVVFDDPIIHRVIEDLGGWTTVCRTVDKEWPFLERRFTDGYRAYRMMASLPPYQRRLPGLAEIANTAAGYVDAKIDLKMIGSPEECARVASKGTMVEDRRKIRMASDFVKSLEQRIES